MEAQNQVVRKLEEKERLLQTNLATVEKELLLRQQVRTLFFKAKLLFSVTMVLITRQWRCTKGRRSSLLNLPPI